jgi:hypothetical protein
MRPPPLAIRASAHSEQRVNDLWLSATGAVVNGGWRPRTNKNAGPRVLFPWSFTLGCVCILMAIFIHLVGHLVLGRLK